MSKNGFGSYGSISAPGGASGSSDPLSQGRVALATKSMGSRAQIQAIVPCVNQLLTSTLVDNIFKNRGIKISQVSVMGIIRQAEKTVSYFIRLMIWPVNLSRSASGLAEIKQSRRWLCFQWEYIPVFGILECSAEVKSLEMLKIHVLQDMNEYSTHIF